MLLRLVLLACACALSASTFAACDGKTNATDCTPSTYQTADANLEAAYQTLHDRLQNQTVLRRRLINSQRAWRAFRDAECEYVGAHGEHNGRHTENFEQCAQALSEQRTRALQHYLQCAEADTACQVAVP